MKVAFIVDPICNFDIKKDTTYMMMLSANEKKWHQFVFELKDIFLEDGIPYAHGYKLSFTDIKENKKWYCLSNFNKFRLSDFSVIFFRKDQPFNMNFLYITYILEVLENQGVLIINKASALRNFNEKFSIINYLQFAPNTMISSSLNNIKSFISKHEDVIVKPLDAMGGASIFRIRLDDLNKNVILETITCDEKKFVMIQKYCQQIKNGDNRILIINGEPLRYLASRCPSSNDHRGNVSRGASVMVRSLSLKEYKIASIIGKDLIKHGIYFAGIDIIGESLTEINITSPTMVQEIYNNTGINAAEILINFIQNKLKNINL